MKKDSQKIYKHITNKEMDSVLKIQSCILGTVSTFFRDRGFIEISPVMISPITDPLAHDVHKVNIDYEGQKLQLTKSMIFHKQLALMSNGLDKIFVVSPNVRLEKSSKARSRHLLEFQQIDFEIKNGTKEDVFSLIEDFLSELVLQLKTKCKKELSYLGRKLPDIKSPFSRFKTYEMEDKYGKDYENILSNKSSVPFWLESFYREFYDKEEPLGSGKFVNYDLIYPEGFEEGLSGAEREYKHADIIKKMKERNMDFAPYEVYLDLFEEGVIPKTAGAGFGLQRLLRYVTGIKDIEKVVLFPRSPREKIIF